MHMGNNSFYVDLCKISTETVKKAKFDKIVFVDLSINLKIEYNLLITRIKERYIKS